MVNPPGIRMPACPVQAPAWVAELSSTIPLFTVDLDQRVTHWAPSCEPVLGPSSEAVGRLCYEVMGPHTRQCRQHCAVVVNARAGRPTRPFGVCLDNEQPSTITTILHRDAQRPAILHVLQPGRVEIDERLSGGAPARGELPELTPRQVEVLRRLAQGESPREIAERLDLRHVTVRNHLQAALERLGAHNRLEAVLIARRYGLV